MDKQPALEARTRRVWRSRPDKGLNAGWSHDGLCVVAERFGAQWFIHDKGYALTQTQWVSVWHHFIDDAMPDVLLPSMRVLAILRERPGQTTPEAVCAALDAILPCKPIINVGHVAESGNFVDLAPLLDPITVRVAALEARVAALEAISSRATESAKEPSP